MRFEGKVMDGVKIRKMFFSREKPDKVFPNVEHIRW